MLRLKSFMIIILIGVMLIASIIASTVVSTLSSIFEDQLLGWSYVVGILNLLLSMVLLTLLFAAIYKTLPQRQLIWKDVMIGAAITALLFIIGKNVTVMYITRSAVGSTFGAAGSLVVLLVWIYYSAQIFLLGAEFTKIYAERYGSTCRKNTQDDHSIERGWA
jgi:membrane protein